MYQARIFIALTRYRLCMLDARRYPAALPLTTKGDHDHVTLFVGGGRIPGS